MHNLPVHLAFHHLNAVPVWQRVEALLLPGWLMVHCSSSPCRDIIMRHVPWRDHPVSGAEEENKEKSLSHGALLQAARTKPPNRALLGLSCLPTSRRQRRSAPRRGPRALSRLGDELLQLWPLPKDRGELLKDGQWSLHGSGRRIPRGSWGEKKAIPKHSHVCHIHCLHCLH